MHQKGSLVIKVSNKDFVRSWHSIVNKVARDVMYAQIVKFAGCTVIDRSRSQKLYNSVQNLDLAVTAM